MDRVLTQCEIMVLKNHLKTENGFYNFVTNVSLQQVMPHKLVHAHKLYGQSIIIRLKLISII